MLYLLALYVGGVVSDVPFLLLELRARGWRRNVGVLAPVLGWPIAVLYRSGGVVRSRWLKP